MGICCSSAARPAAERSSVAADVVVIGAGMSGIAAANALKAKGITNVVVLESRDRIGGRVWTTNTTANGKTFPVELGAMWIHGVSGNPLVALAKSAGVSLQAKDTNYDNSMLYYANGKDVPDATGEK
jgi:monoamine oxidase